MYEIFKQLCEQMGITTYKFCKDTGINASTISTWKNRNTKCSMKLAVLIAKYFSVSVDYIMTGKKAEDIRKEDFYLLQNRDLVNVMEKIQKLPIKKRNMIVGMIDGMLTSIGE